MECECEIKNACSAAVVYLSMSKLTVLVFIHNWVAFFSSGKENGSLSFVMMFVGKDNSVAGMIR